MSYIMSWKKMVATAPKKHLKSDGGSILNCSPSLEKEGRFHIEHLYQNQ